MEQQYWTPAASASDDHLHSGASAPVPRSGDNMLSLLQPALTCALSIAGPATGAGVPLPPFSHAHTATLSQHIQDQGSPSLSHPTRGPRKPSCQVHGCTADLTHTRSYYRRYRICEEHLRTPALAVHGVISRFCQQCAKFEPLAEFEGGKRSCQHQLLRHNERRKGRKKAAKQGERRAAAAAVDDDEEAEPHPPLHFSVPLQHHTTAVGFAQGTQGKEGKDSAPVPDHHHQPQGAAAEHDPEHQQQQLLAAAAIQDLLADLMSPGTPHATISDLFASSPRDCTEGRGSCTIPQSHVGHGRTGGSPVAGGAAPTERVPSTSTATAHAPSFPAAALQLSAMLAPLAWAEDHRQPQHPPPQQQQQQLGRVDMGSPCGTPSSQTRQGSCSLTYAFANVALHPFAATSPIHTYRDRRPNTHGFPSPRAPSPAPHAPAAGLTSQHWLQLHPQPHQQQHEQPAVLHSPFAIRLDSTRSTHSHSSMRPPYAAPAATSTWPTYHPPAWEPSPMPTAHQGLPHMQRSTSHQPGATSLNSPAGIIWRNPTPYLPSHLDNNQQQQGPRQQQPRFWQQQPEQQQLRPVVPRYSDLVNTVNAARAEYIRAGGSSMGDAGGLGLWPGHGAAATVTTGSTGGFFAHAVRSLQRQLEQAAAGAGEQQQHHQAVDAAHLISVGSTGEQPAKKLRASF